MWSRGQKVEPDQPLTRSLVFDEEKLQTLLEGVFIHVKLHLHPDRREKRQRERRRSAVCVSNDLPGGFGDDLSLRLCSKLDNRVPVEDNNNKESFGEICYQLSHLTQMKSGGTRSESVVSHVRALQTALSATPCRLHFHPHAHIMVQVMTHNQLLLSTQLLARGV